MTDRKYYDGVCTQETLSYMLNVPRTTIRDWWKRNNIDLQHGVTSDIVEKTYHHFVIKPAMTDFVSHCTFIGSIRNGTF